MSIREDFCERRGGEEERTADHISPGLDQSLDQNLRVGGC